MLHPRLVCGPIAFLMLMAPVNAAGATSADKQRADNLFKLAVKELNSKNFDKACPMLEESYRLDPTPGVLFTLAYCEYEVSSLIASRNKFQEFLKLCDSIPMERKAPFTKRIAIATERLALLKKEIPKLTLSALAPIPNGTRIFVDEKLFPIESIGKPMEFDPGKHTIRVEAPTADSETRTIHLQRGGSITREIPLPEGPHGNALEARSTSKLRIGGLIGLGIGSAGFAAWGITGGWALAIKPYADEHCPNLICDKSGMQARDKGRMLLDIAAVGLGVGIAGISVGTVMLLVNQKRESNNPAKQATQIVVMDVNSAGASVGVRGVF